jgi:hypothetical protein
MRSIGECGIGGIIEGWCRELFPKTDEHLKAEKLIPDLRGKLAAAGSVLDEPDNGPQWRASEISPPQKMPSASRDVQKGFSRRKPPMKSRRGWSMSKIEPPKAALYPSVLSLK